MLAAIATAVPLPNFSLISFVTWSQTSCLREEITTLAPCSAIRSAMARPMPRVEPVMTATFPVISNKVMSFSQMLIGFFRLELSSLCGFRQLAASGEFLLRRRDLRAGRLVHRVVRSICDPGLLVDHRQPPSGVIVARKMIEPRHRAIVDIEGEALVRLAAERQRDGGPDRAAMR